MPEIRHGTHKEASPEGGGTYGGGDEGTIREIKDAGSSPKRGNTVQTSKKGLNKVKGKT